MEVQGHKEKEEKGGQVVPVALLVQLDKLVKEGQEDKLVQQVHLDRQENLEV